MCIRIEEKKKNEGEGEEEEEERKNERKVFGKMEGRRGSLCGIQQASKRDAPRSIPMFPTFFVHPRGDVLIRRVQSTGSLRFH